MYSADIDGPKACGYGRSLMPSSGIHVSWRTARHTEGTRGTMAETTTSTTSADGTVIGWRRSGEGPPAVLVHGTGGDATNWDMCSGFLEPHHTLLAVDRRGRGRSSDTSPYDFQREVEDVAAVVTTLDEPPHLIGHSYGAVLALTAAHAGVPVRSLVLYEPPLLQAPDILDAPALRAACEAAIDDGDPDRCFQTFFDAIGEGHAADLARTIPEVWERFLRDAHTIPREIKASAGWSVKLADDVRAPTLLVFGTESHELFHRSIEALAQVLPQVEISHLEGQGHMGLGLAPELVAQNVLGFLTRH